MQIISILSLENQGQGVQETLVRYR